MYSLFSGGVKWERRKVPGKPKKPQGKRKGKVQKTYEEQKQFNLAMSQGSKRHQEVFASDAWSVPEPLRPTRDPLPNETPAQALARLRAEEESKSAPVPMDPEDIEECLDHLDLFVPMPPHHGRHAIPSTPKHGRLCDRLVPESELAEFETVSEMLGECARLEELAEKARASHDVDTEFECVSRWGMALSRQNVTESTALVYEALDLAEQMDDSWRVWVCLSNLATVHAKHNQAEKALAYERKCLDLGREMGSHALEAVSLFNVAALHHLMGYLRKAQRFYAEARAIAEEVGHESLTGFIDVNVTVIRVYLKRAQKKAEEAEALRQKKLKAKQRGK